MSQLLKPMALRLYPIVCFLRGTSLADFNRQRSVGKFQGPMGISQEGRNMRERRDSKLRTPRTVPRLTRPATWVCVSCPQQMGNLSGCRAGIVFQKPLRTREVLC